MPDISPEPQRVGLSVRDLTLGISLLMAVGVVCGLDASRLPLVVPESDERTLLELPGEVPHETSTVAAVTGVEQPVTEQSPASQQLLFQQPAIPAQLDELQKPGGPLLTEKALGERPLFAATQPMAPVLRNERPPSNPEQKVEFFAVKSAAQTVAFVVDCSSSMQGSRFDRARLELAHSISKLKPDQGVYTVFFSDGPVPLPGEQLDKPALVLASSWIKYETAKRLSVMHTLGGTHPEPSLKIAASLNPDVIFLLSDGDFAPLSRELESEFRTRGIKVHTIAFESPAGSRLLEQISQKTGGTFRYVPPGEASLSTERVLAEIAGQLIGELQLGSADQRDRVHKALVEMARGRDFGPKKPGAAELDRAIASWWSWYREMLALGYRTSTEAEIVQVIRTGSPHERCAAVMAAGQRKLNIPTELIAAVADVDAVTAQQARQALIQLADQCDFGPAENASEAERAQATARWQRWLECQTLIRDLIRAGQPAVLAALCDVDAAHRWAAVSVARRQKLNVPDELLAALEDRDEDVQTDAGKALVALIPRGDLGPTLGKVIGKYVPDRLIELLSHAEPHVCLAAERALEELARAEDRTWSRTWPPGGADSIPRWKRWWTALKEQFAERRFTLAQELFKKGKSEPAERRFRELIKEFPGTPSAQKAEKLLLKKAN